MSTFTSVTHCLQASTCEERGRGGGLVIRRAASLALPVLLASAVAKSNLQSAILSRDAQNVDKEVELAWILWCSLTTTLPPVGPFKPPEEPAMLGWWRETFKSQCIRY